MRSDPLQMIIRVNAVQVCDARDGDQRFVADSIFFNKSYTSGGNMNSYQSFKGAAKILIVEVN